jgi:hypothetical protein
MPVVSRGATGAGEEAGVDVFKFGGVVITSSTE